MHWVTLPTASCRKYGLFRDACRQAFEELFSYLSQSSVVSSVRGTLRLPTSASPGEPGSMASPTCLDRSKN